MTITIVWKQCRTYKEASDFTNCLYLHEWNAKPYYWGICNASVFGGNPRMIEGKRRQPRYGSSYRHWIEGCLEHGGMLYIGKCEANEPFDLEQVESTLIAVFPSKQNRESGQKYYEVVHAGDIPICIKSQN
jgi:hypothetical protein